MQVDVHPAKSVVELLQARAQHVGDKVAYTFIEEGGEAESRLTYGELDRRARAAAAILQGLGAPGDRALLLYPPGIEYVVAFVACFYAGLVAVPAYPPEPARLQRALPRLKGILEDARPALALTTSAVLSMAEHLFPGDAAFAALRWVATDTVDDGARHGWVDPAPGASTLAMLQYTSGSTRQPRGVMLTHGNLLANLEVMRRAFSLRASDRVVSWLPPYHDMGLIGAILVPVFIGGDVVLLSPTQFLQRPFSWLSAVSRHRATVTGGPNFGYELCARKISPEQRAALDLRCLEVAFVGAEPIRAETLGQFAEAFAPAGFDRNAYFPCYGLAESTLFVTGVRRGGGHRVLSISPTAYARRRAVDVPRDAAGRVDLVPSGVPGEGLFVLVVDPDTRAACADQEVGEIWVAGDSVAQGYWGLPEETSALLRAELPAAPGRRFLRTGDLGFFRDGELFVSGRIKDLIIIRGRNHYPQDIEATAERCHARLRRGCAAAFSVDPGPAADGQASEVERLAVVIEVTKEAAGGAETDRDAIVAAIRRAVLEAHDLRVDDVVLLTPGSIPKTSSGKIQRSACRAALLSGELSAIAGTRGAGQAPPAARAAASA